MSFTGKSAIVTGSGQGIGLDICRQLVKQGANVLLNDLDEKIAQRAVKQINEEKYSGTCEPMAGDAGNIAFIQEMVAKVIAQFGKIDIVIANAGITLFGDFFSYSPESFARVLEVNLKGTFFLAQAAAIEMKRQGSGGSLLFMSSVTGHQAHKNLAAYGMSKAALEMLAKNLVIELSPYQITVNAIAPGATLTERTLEDPNYKTTWNSLTPMGRPATVSDITSAVLFLVSENATHITGQSLVIDGGWTSISPQPF